MACGNCNTCDVSERRGCGTSSVFNWLEQIEQPNAEHKNLFEVQFKSDRKDFFINKNHLSIAVGDWVVVESERAGYDIGKVTIIGDLAALQMQRKKRKLENTIKKIIRKAREKELQELKSVHIREEEILRKAKVIIKEFNIKMKLSDVELQVDRTKATFYYTAEKRVDFRQLIKEYSKVFKVKIEMKQIGVRQEAAKIGGIGSCGRELCCSTWMTEFPSVNTSAARYQQLSINPEKLSGQCGRLKCCLNFELDAYVEAMKDFPDTKIKLKSKQGEARFYKMDVFNNKMYYFFNNSLAETIELSTKRAFKIIRMNQKGKLPETFQELKGKTLQASNKSREDSIFRFDKRQKK